MTTSYDDRIVAHVRSVLCGVQEVADATDKQILAAYQCWCIEGMNWPNGDRDWTAFPRLLIPSVRRNAYIRMGYTFRPKKDVA